MTLRCGGQPRPALPKKIKKEVLEELTEKTMLKPKEIKALYRRFRLLARESGYLFPEQFRQTMGVLGLTDDPFLPDRMFLVFDIDQDGKLSFFEFASSLAVMIRGTEDEKLKLSFEMTAGRRGAPSISFKDFQQLIRACSTMMQSLVTPDALPVDDVTIRRMFRDLSSDESNDEDAVITMEDYKAAAQSNDDFLECLGLQAPSVASRSKLRRNTPPPPQSVRKSSKGSASCGSSSQPCAAGAPDHYLVSAAQLNELRERVAALRESVLRGKANSEMYSDDDTTFISPRGNGLQRAAKEDPNERLWTPLPGRPRQRNLRSPKPTPTIHDDASPAPYLASVDDLANEFDKVLGLCTQATGGRSEHDSRNASGLMVNRSPSCESSPCANGVFGRTEDDFRMQNSPTTADDFVAIPSYGSKGLSDDREMASAVSRMRHHTQTPVALKSRKRHRLLGPKKGLAVHFGHENWNMVLSMMIGIRMSVGRIKHEMSRPLTPVDFIMKEKFSIIPRLANIFDSEVSKRVTMTRFYDYAPMVFHRIRSHFGINHDEYLRSVGPEQLLGNMVLGNLSSLSELSSEGKSGAFFYYTADGKYMMKTVTPKEQQLLKRVLKRYYDHITTNTGSLLVRFLGLHCLRVRKVTKGISRDRRLHFVVMGNMFNTPFEIHRRYDLKGSWVGRQTPGREHLDPTIALKDVDFKQASECINVGPEEKDRLVKIMENDTAFLRDINVIDYSLLLGIHDIGSAKTHAEDSGEDADDGKALTQIPQSQNADSTGSISQLQHGVSAATLTSHHGGGATHLQQNASSSHSCSSSKFTADEMVHDASVHQKSLAGIYSSDKRQLYFFGIIDILTPYDSMKKFEHHFKAIRYNDRRGVSCCPPVFYAERFNDFMRTAFQ